MAAGRADVRVVGVGGGGSNALRRMARERVAGVTLVAANTDAQALSRQRADAHVLLGRRATRGMGAGARPAVGLAAAQESAAAIAREVAGADLVFVAAGLGGGTGTGAAPLVASIARDGGALVVGVVTLPFRFEGARRMRAAREGVEVLAPEVDSLLVIENDRLLELGDDEPTALDAFARADAVLGDAVRGISDLVLRHGLVNLDFADVRAVLRNGGRAVMGIGAARGRERALRALERASTSPLLSSACIQGARGVLISFTIDPRLGLGAIHEAAARAHAQADDDAEILFGVAVDPSLCDEARVTLVAAGLEREAPVRRRNALVMLA